MGLHTPLIVALALLVAAVVAQINPPPGAPSSITVQFIIRDVVGQNPPSWGNKTTHPDFERVNAQDPGIVNYRLGGDRKPSLNSSVVSKTWTNATTFGWAWNDRPGVNLRLTRLFTMNWSTSSGLYEYSNSAFFPIDNDGYGNFTTAHNFHFCLEYHTQFKYRGTESFTFTGDDDVYFFVNNQLFVDLGGVHGAITVNRDLKNTTAVQLQYGMSVGSIYNFDFFFCERHTSASNLKMATNILLNDCPFIDACGSCYSVATPSTVLVNPCNVLNCNNGLCSCQNATCQCNPGWTDGPLGNCTQNCGDGIIQGSEQCDPPGPCCSSTCKFVAADTSCPSLGKPCVNYVCTGTSTTCGVPRPIGSTCNGGGNAPQCQQYQCTSADGSTCGLVVNTALTCTDNNACTTDVCLSTGVCQSTSTVCNASACRNAGVCDTTTGVCSQGSAKADGTGCGADPGSSSCVIPTCQAGTCNVNSPKPINTPCGSVSADGCSTQVCNGAGSCAPIAVTSAQGTKASCPQPGPGSCLQALCTGLACVNSSIADGSTCANASVTLNSCQRLGCVGGSCQAVADAAREGQSCTDNGALNSYGDDQCNMKVCSSGQCVRKVNTATDGNTCNIFASGPNPEPTCRTYTCSAGTCTRSNINDAGTCTNASLVTTNCTRLQCVSGTCSINNFNNGGKCNDDINNGCTFYRCDNNGACLAKTATVDLPCGSTSLKCNLSFCTAQGTCQQKPVVCDTSVCNGALVCNQALGVCELPTGTQASCCGNGKIDPLTTEQCDDPSNPCCVNCQFAPIDTQCSTNECNPKTCQLIQSGLPNTTCTDNFKNGLACTSTNEPTNQCLERRCSGGVCTIVNKADNTACSLNNVPYCAQAVCISGDCQIVADAAKTGTNCSTAFGTVPECNQAVCVGTQCVLNDFNDGLPCSVLPQAECRDRKCSGGSCVYDTTNFPKSLSSTCSGVTSNTACLVPGCDGAGNCILLNNTAGTACTRTNNPECNVPQCDAGGQCILNPINVGQSCSAVRDLQCQVSNCDVNGNCAVSNVTDGVSCTRTDVDQCQDSVCQGGACVLVNTVATSRACVPAPNPAEDRSCFDYFCQADGTCATPTNKADGTPCTDANLCDTDTCKAGVCTHVVSVVCNTPTLPCQVPIGTCIAAYGNCTYSGRGQYSPCTPRAEELDPRCNATISGEYRCATGAADSVCTPACFTGGVCGDGIVQDGEDCDWGDERTGGPCCNITCKWFQELAPCAPTDPDQIATTNAQITELAKSSGLPELCFVQRCVLQSGVSQCVLGLDTTVDKKCADTGNSKSNRTAILASVIPGALIALLLAGLGFFFWRRAQKAAESEWLQEYLNAGNVRVENNAAFVETQASVANAAFQPDGK